MGRFSETVLESFNVDVGRSLHAVCPFCGGDLVIGPRKDTGAVSLGHSAIPDPVTGVHIAGCEAFRGLAYTSPREFFALLRSQGTRFTRLAG